MLLYESLIRYIIIIDNSLESAVDMFLCVSVRCCVCQIKTKCFMSVPISSSSVSQCVTRSLRDSDYCIRTIMHACTYMYMHID